MKIKIKNNIGEELLVHLTQEEYILWQETGSIPTRLDGMSKAAMAKDRPIRWSDKFPHIKQDPDYRAGFLHGKEIASLRREGGGRWKGHVKDDVLINLAFARGYWDGGSHV